MECVVRRGDRTGRRFGFGFGVHGMGALRALLTLSVVSVLASGCGGAEEPEVAVTAAVGEAQPSEDLPLVAAVPSDEPPSPEVVVPPPDAIKTPSGLTYKILSAGDGERNPRPYDKVTVHYKGWTSDGRVFDSSYARGHEMTFALNQVIAGWTEGLQLMVVGDTARFWVPEDLTYQGAPGRPAGTLVFDVELLKLDPAPGSLSQPKPIPAPDDVAAPPEDAQWTESGIAYRILKEGTGSEHPGPDDRVEVHYSGWTTRGRNFDSSVARGKPANFPVDKVMPGWGEAVQLMVVGEKRRFWIPEHLAFNGIQGRPAGTLVYDIELLGFEVDTAEWPEDIPTNR